jgi:hypothetical protein
LKAPFVVNVLIIVNISSWWRICSKELGLSNKDKDYKVANNENKLGAE